MTQRAILVGVQDYGFKPLTAPAKDARDMRDALVAAGIFARDETLLLVDDGSGQDVDGPATREAILAALAPFYKGEACSRLFFYFSGHGASWRVSSGASVLKPVLLCHGVDSFADDGGAMIDVDELLERFKMRGPDEQVWVIDACRNIPENEGRPVVPPTTWGDQPAIAVRRRSLVYAVAPLAQAAAIQGENSIFTREFLEGLEGKGSAPVYDPETDTWVVSAHSICLYAQERLSPGLAGWERDFKLPRIEFESDPPPGPLRVLPPHAAPQPRPVTLEIDPDDASSVVSAQLKLQGATLAQWPPHQASAALPPAVYRFEAKLAAGSAWQDLAPQVTTIDTRQTDRIAVTVSGRVRRTRRGFSASVAKPVVPTGSQLIEVRRSKRRANQARVEIQAADPTIGFSATLHGSATAPIAIASRPRKPDPYTWQVGADLAPGLWRIEARLGDEFVGCADVDLAAGMSVVLRLIASMPEALSEAAWKAPARVEPSAASPALVVSERMGPIQAAVLPSVLPLLALKAFDPSVLANMVAPWLASAPPGPNGVPVSVAIAMDGDWGSLPLPNVGSASLQIASGSEVRRFSDGSGLAVLAAPQGLAEAGPGVADSPGMNLATLRIPRWGRLEFALPRVPGRAACVGAVIRAGGRFELTIASLAALPGQDPAHTRSQSARAVAIGARLHGSGMKDSRAVNDAAYGKWIDPVLGAIAWYAIANRRSKRNSGDLATIARNMFAAFPSLADSLLLLHWLIRHSPIRYHYPGVLDRKLLRALLDGDGTNDPHLDAELQRVHQQFWDSLPYQAQPLARDTWKPRRLTSVFADQPVLAASVDRLADLAETHIQGNHWSVRRRALIDPTTAWNAVYSPDTEGGHNA